MYKDLYNSTVRKQTTQFKNGQKTETDIPLKRIYIWQVSTQTDIQHH